jgi:hypothetical protein
MEATHRVVLQLEAITSDRQPIRGLVRAGDGHVHAFSGWSEMFAVLQTLTSGPGDGTGKENST